MIRSASATTPSRQFQSFSEITSFIWGVADLLRGDYKQSDYGKVILPFTVLRRLDCVLDATRQQVLARHESLQGSSVKNLDPILNRLTGVPFHNISKLSFDRLKDDPGHIAANVTGYIKGFSDNAREIFIERFKFPEHIQKLDDANLLYQVLCRFAEVDLHPETVPNHVMGSIFEELIRRFSEQSNETAGEHFTPREVIRLMVNLLFIEDHDVLTRPGIVKTLYDPACGTGGMLSVAEEYLRELNPDAVLKVFGQELNDESFAICKSDMMIKGQDPDNIKRGNSFDNDGHVGMTFDYLLSNPPFGVEWKKVEKAVRDEADTRGYAGRFGAGLPRINDGSFLFLQHMIAKMKPARDGGSRIAIVFNGSPLFTGDAGSGESDIRRWIIENDWLEAIVGLPEQLFYNTGINTYIWLVTNKKPPARRGKIQLINASGLFDKMRKSLGNKRNYLTDVHIAEITRLYGDFQPGPGSKIFDNDDFGYRRIVVERPLKLNFQASPERIARLHEEKAFDSLASSKKRGQAGELESELGQRLQAQILAMLQTLDPDKVWTNRDAFQTALHAAVRQAGLKLPPPVQKAILSALSERDETAEICTDSKGHPEPDSDLRDYENVPLKEPIEPYFAREVLPHVPDAWIDEGKTRVGYEIPFTRHFYEYKPLRPLAEIEAEIRALEAEIQGIQQALVTQAVTKGFDLTVPMKDSGIEWLEEIPAHWEVVRLRRLARIYTGVAKGRKLEGPIVTLPYLRVANVQDGYVDLSNVAEIEVPPSEVERFSLKRGDILMNEGGDNDKLGRGTVWEGQIEPCLHQNHVFAVRPKPGVNPYWIALATQSTYLKFYFMSRAVQSTNLASISASNLREAPIVLPPANEANAILSEVSERLCRTDVLLERVQLQIEKLREYRQALISAAVTGKIDVTRETA
jgi:type I restriction enzyme M protein